MHGTVLTPKEFNSESAGILPFHLDLVFPDKVDNLTVSDAVNKVCSFHITQDGVFLCVHHT